VFSRRLGQDWQDLADYFEIPTDQRHRFESGRGPQGVWEWLEARDKLAELPEALHYIDRDDIVAEVLVPPSIPAPAAAVTWDGSPFPGLRPFTPHDAAIFFGRTLETAALLDRLRQEHFVAVIGASGSGKSSLVAAGVLPRLQEMSNRAPWQWVRCTPGGLGDDPFVALAARLEPGLERHDLNERAIADKLRASGDLATLADLFLVGSSEAAPLLLFIDQFEELFTLCQPEFQHRFIAMLVRAVQSPRLRMVLTLRADFYHRCVEHSRLAALLRTGSFPLAAPDMPARLSMITGPAAVAGLTFEEGLAGRILRDTGSEPGALALMAFALAELYTTCQPRTTLTHAAYDGFGGVQGAIAQRAETAYAGLEVVAQQALGEVFKHLVEVDPERGIPTRKRARLAHFADAPAAQQLIEGFAAARLLVCDDPDDSDAVVEVAHEALLTHWSRLHDWITDRFDDLRLLRHLRLEAAEWDRRGRMAAHLWRYERLPQVTEMLERLQPVVLSDTERDFIRPEVEQLLAEIADPATTHQRRAVIGDRLAEIGDPRPGVGLNRDGLPAFDWVPVPGGTIALEGVAGTFQVQPFAISKYPVTRAQYRSFHQAADGYENADWWQRLPLGPESGHQYDQQDNHPAESVSWYEAIAFCRWLSSRLGYEVRLPTEWEWQQAATGSHAENEFPWGADWSSAHANTRESGLSRTVAVGLHPQGASPLGVLDMCGNVWEWCLNEYDVPQRVTYSGFARQVVRGSSWNDTEYCARARFRNYLNPAYRYFGVGLRVVRSSPSLS
jgi:formylglycine-generating enzyme required for sulfatase activity